MRRLLARLGSRYRYRVVVGLLIASLPVTVALATLLTQRASSSLTTSAETRSEQTARSIALHLEDFISERQESLGVVAQQASGDLASPAVQTLAARIDKSSHSYDLIEVTDLTGRVTAASRSKGQFNPRDETWFATAAAGQQVITTPTEANHDIRWALASPVLDPAGRPVGVVVADLDEAVLHRLLNPELQSGADVVAVNRDHKLVYSTALGEIDGPALLAKGSLTTTIDNAAVTQALAGKSGAARFHSGGHDIVGGYDGVDDLDWAVVVQERASTVLAPVASQRRAAIVLVALGAALAIGILDLVRPARGEVPHGRGRREHQGQYVGEFGGG